MAEDPTRRLVPLMIALSATTGIIDAVSVLGLGRVFTANMTGNIVFLGFAFAQAPGFEVAPALAALLFFLAGAVIGGRIAGWLGMPRLRDWVVIAGGIEALLLGAAAAAGVGYSIGSLHPEPSRYAMIALTALAMGLRNATVRQLKVADLTTTVLTLTIAGLAADSPLGGGTNPNWQRRLASVGSIFLGALVGAVLLLHFGVTLPLLVAAAIALVASLLSASRLP